ncbi:acyl-CoA synthetase [Microbacterium sp.]|uniref:acyl-CoA synthetase n=1 Tax=Microbacterium sp. TaxID=51671 RepID=UPI0028121774|nr:acyl-CoA synthetase [Microbacterium sp.]
MPAPSRPFTARHVQLCRALLAAVAAVMITFSPDHSAVIGLTVFGGFAVVTAFVLALAAGLVFPAGRRWPFVLMAAVSLVTGMAASVVAWRSDDLFFVLVITWAALTGLVELLAGIRFRGTDGARDAITVGALGLLLALALLVVPSGFVQQYTIDSAGTFSLTGIILGVGLFGGYAAIVAVFLGIAGLTPRAKEKAAGAVATPAGADSVADHGGHA